MAEAARHVNTMEAHHAPNWSRKQHVDGAHDKPSATSGSHGRRPHNTTKPKTKHAPIDNESWSHADARAARLGRTESLSGYLFGSAFSRGHCQRRRERLRDSRAERRAERRVPDRLRRDAAAQCEGRRESRREDVHSAG